MKLGLICVLPFFQILISPTCALASIFKSCAMFLWRCVLSIGMSVTRRDLQARQRRIRNNDRQVKLKALLQKRKDEWRAQLREKRRQREAQQREDIRQREAEDEGRRRVDINRQDGKRSICFLCSSFVVFVIYCVQPYLLATFLH